MALGTGLRFGRGHLGVAIVLAGALVRAQVGPGITMLQEIADAYVRLVLAVGQHDADYVDAYYGPPEVKAAVGRETPTLDAIGQRASALTGRLGTAVDDGTTGSDRWSALRHEHLRRQLHALRTRVRMLTGTKLAFDEESRALYDAVAPPHDAAHFQRVLDQLQQLLPGDGPLIERYDRFRRDFVIPGDRLSTVFDLAIAECRRRTLAHVALPRGETFTLEYVTNKSWSGYNWYQGEYRSVIQVNTDLPIYVDRGVDLACHEGYPGHHVYNVLLEHHLVRARGWTEFAVYPLFSPQSLIAEGTANYGIEVAFPGDERLRFERDVLFPAAGLDPSRAEAYARVHAIVERLSYAGNEAARRYLDGEWDRSTAARWLAEYALMSPPRAEQRTRFMDQYRSYVINYNLGQDLVKQFVEQRAGTQVERRWHEFVQLLTSPRLPSGLVMPPRR